LKSDFFFRKRQVHKKMYIKIYVRLFSWAKASTIFDVALLRKFLISTYEFIFTLSYLWAYQLAC